MTDGEVQPDLQGFAKRLGEAETIQEKEDLLTVAQSKEATNASRRRETSFQKHHLVLIAILLFLFILHGLATLLFANGFLLTRLVLSNKSQCSNPPVKSSLDKSSGSTDAGCWHPKKFNKAVIIIIDALRYDFTVPSRLSPRDGQPEHYFNNALTFLYDTAEAYPGNAFLRPFIADPPTTTLQRLKALTTGTLPTFIDIGSNFAGTAIDEDNLIAQLGKAGKNVVHIGDDTWHSLFPGLFDGNLTRPYDSFNVWDLFTVDNGVKEHLVPLLDPSMRNRWDVAIGHLLGVDHAGHRYGPDHPAMKSKLQEMDDFLRQIARLIDDDTLLVVMGDHGMDVKGDHGGESDDEVEAALWMYSKAPVFGRSSEDFASPPKTAKERPVTQIDLVPTLALLLGLPIPFNNLGSPIEEAFLGLKGDDFQTLAKVNRLTAAQIKAYQHEYSAVSKPDASSGAVPEILWHAAVTSWERRMNSSSKVSPEQWQSLAGAFSSYEKSALDLFRTMWAQFDLVNMSLGIGMIASIAVVFLLYGRGLGSSAEYLNTNILSFSIPSLLLGCAASIPLSTAFPALGSLRACALFGGGTSLLALLAALLASRHRARFPRPTSLSGTLSLSLPLLLSLGFAANSFTIWEDSILVVMLSSIGVLLLTQSLRIPSLSVSSTSDRRHAVAQSIIFIFCIRTASLSRLCREEQMPFCRSTFYASATSSTSAPWQLAIPYAIALLLPLILKYYYTRTQSYHGSAPFWLGFAFRLSLLLIAVYWTLDAADNGKWPVIATRFSEDTQKTARMYLAQFILCLAIGAGSATFAWQAPMIGVETVRTRVPEADLTPEQKRKGASGKGDVWYRDALVIHGTGNLYGAHFAILPLTVLLIPLLLLQKPMGQFALSTTVVAILSLLEVLAALRKHALLRAAAQGVPPAIGPVTLALLAHHAYFTTGHQAALASLQWDAAFVPLRTLSARLGNRAVAGLCMVGNTFAGQILCSAAVPLTVLWRRDFKPRLAQGESNVVAASLLKAYGNQSSDREEEDDEELGSEPDVAVEAGKEPVVSQHTRLLRPLATAYLTHILVYALIQLATTVFAAHLRRHLMLYRVFSPRWMLATTGMLVAEVAGLMIGLGGMRWSVAAVGSLFGW